MKVNLKEKKNKKNWNHENQDLFTLESINHVFKIKYSIVIIGYTNFVTHYGFFFIFRYDVKLILSLSKIE